MNTQTTDKATCPKCGQLVKRIGKGLELHPLNPLNKRFACTFSGDLPEETTDKATARPLKLSTTNDTLVCRDERTWEKIFEVKSVDAIKAVNEHAALIAVAEAAKKVERSLMEHYQAGIAMRPQAVTTLYGDLNHALANLAAVRGESEGGK